MKVITEISWIYFFLFLFLSGVLTWYFYIHKNKWAELPKKTKYIIYSLRFTALFFLLILLLGVFLDKKITKEEKPILLTLIDNSSSILNYKDSINVKKSLPKIIEKIKSLNSKYEQRFYMFGDNLKNGENINFTDNKTNLSAPFESIFTEYYNRNIGAIILISDGNYNEGLNPSYSASKIPFTPIFTIGVGDTLQKSDQILKDVIHNEVAFMNSKFPIQVNIEAHKLKTKNSIVKLYQNGKLIDSKNISYSNLNYDFQQINFEIEPKNKGFQSFKVVVEGVTGEHTLKNNTQQFFIEILDSKNRILLLSSAPHPDMSALKSAFELDANIDVIYQNLEKWDKNLKNTDLIIWHEPGVNFNEEINNFIQNSHISILYILGSNTNNTTIRKLNIGLDQANSNQTDEVQASFSDGFELFEIDEKTRNEVEKYPPLVVKFGMPKISNQNQVLLNQKVGNVSKKEPLIYFGSNPNTKYGVILGEGIWRWKMANYLKHKNHDYFNDFFAKINQYLVQKKNTSNLRISLPKRFGFNDDILIKGEFYNEAMELITKPKLNFQLIDNKGDKSNLEFGVQNDSYLLKLGKLNPGLYQWTANTTFNGKKYQKSGSFVIENINIEKLDSKANHSLLKQLSSISDGKFYEIMQYDKIFSDIEAREDIAIVEYQQNEVVSLLDLIWILFIIIALLSFEWFIKRWNGYY